MYKDLFSYGHIFVKKSTFLQKTSTKAFIFFEISRQNVFSKCIIYLEMLQKTYEQ